MRPTFLAEYAPSNHRGLYCSLVPASTATGLLIGSALATFMFMTWGHDSSFVTEWGWRIPFLLAGPLGLITHYIRTRVSDSPVYQEMQEKLEAKGESRRQAHQASAHQAPAAFAGVLRRLHAERRGLLRRAHLPA